MCSNEGYLDLHREFDDFSDLENQSNTKVPEDNIDQTDAEDDLSDCQELDDENYLGDNEDNDDRKEATNNLVIVNDSLYVMLMKMIKKRRLHCQV